MKCYLCDSKQYSKRDGSVRDNKALEIFECDVCSLVFLSSISHINEGYYEESNMSKDINVKQWLSDTHSDDLRRFNFLKPKIINRDILDFGSGVGGFLLEAQKFANSVTGIELDTKVVDHYKENNINLVSDIDSLQNESYDLITAFHVIEHLKEPIEILDSLLKKLKKGGSLIVEVPNSNDILLTTYENEGFQNFTYWSPHLYLYNDKTFRILFSKLSENIDIDFIKYIQRYPLSNHLYWLSKNKPGGHKVWGNFLDSEELNKAYTAQLASIGATDTLIAQITKR